MHKRNFLKPLSFRGIPGGKTINVLFQAPSREPLRLTELCAKSFQLCPTLWYPMDYSLSGCCPWDSPGTNTGVGCHALLLEIFPTQDLNLDFLYLLHLQVGFLPLESWDGEETLAWGPEEQDLVALPLPLVR